MLPFFFFSQGRKDNLLLDYLSLFNPPKALFITLWYFSIQSCCWSDGPLARLQEKWLFVAAEAGRIKVPPPCKSLTKLRKRSITFPRLFFPWNLKATKLLFLLQFCNPQIETSFMLWSVSLSVPFCSGNESNGIDYTCAW